jgi:hypothetical protein
MAGHKYIRYCHDGIDRIFTETSKRDFYSCKYCGEIVICPRNTFIYLDEHVCAFLNKPTSSEIEIAIRKDIEKLLEGYIGYAKPFSTTMMNEIKMEVKRIISFQEHLFGIPYMYTDVIVTLDLVKHTIDIKII